MFKSPWSKQETWTTSVFHTEDDPDRTALLVKLVMLELHQAEDSATFIPLPHEPRCRVGALSQFDTLFPSRVVEAPAAAHAS